MIARYKPRGRHYKRARLVWTLKQAAKNTWRWLTAIDEYPRWLLLIYLYLASQGLGYMITLATGWEMVRS